MLQLVLAGALNRNVKSIKRKLLFPLTGIMYTSLFNSTNNRHNMDTSQQTQDIHFQPENLVIPFTTIKCKRHISDRHSRTMDIRIRWKGSWRAAAQSRVGTVKG